MSNPQLGDVVLARDYNGVLTIAMIYAVNQDSVDAMRVNTFGQNPVFGVGWQWATGLTEVTDPADLTASTWCRRERCG